MRTQLLFWAALVDLVPFSGEGRADPEMRRSRFVTCSTIRLVRWQACSHGAGGRFWTFVRLYFPAELRQEEELDSEKQYIFAMHPHGVVGISTWLNFVREACVGVLSCFCSLATAVLFVATTGFSVVLLTFLGLGFTLVASAGLVSAVALAFVLFAGLMTFLVAGLAAA